ncbi:MAG: thiol:disulfide interchange protein [Caldimonas sp.]|nr:MAG: thiol:disulfide interchange protein [Caldimonas sp.]
MKRREFTAAAGVAVLGLAGLAPQTTRAQVPKAGSDYVVLRPALPGGTDGKIEVIEFFWYGCPHCNRFQPLIEPWAKKLPADVLYRRVPVAFREEFVVHQRIYYALEALGQIEAVHKKVFHAVHVERNPLNKPEAIADFMARQGIDRAKFLEAFNSFGVQTKIRQARQIAEGYKIDGVPAIGINGRYWTSGALAGSLERSLQVADYLIGQARAGR